ncbi:MAG: hypothetical protein O9327_03470 [Polaromonas sp.]|nr:hypothetical protein [Polaromonas sp.]
MSKTAKYTQFAVLTFGASLLAAGLYLWIRGELVLPSRRPPTAFHFHGGPLFLLGLSPITAGALSLAIGFDKVDRASWTAHALIFVSMSTLAGAFLLAPKF